MKLLQLFQNYEVELTPEIKKIMMVTANSILVPSKIEAKFKYINKKDLEKIHPDTETAKELVLMIVKNLSDTYILSQQNNSSEAIKMGYKVLNSQVLSEQVKYDKKIASPYKKIIDLLLKYDVIEKGRNYSSGKRSNEYRLTATYFGKGFVEYTLNKQVLVNKNLKHIETNVEKVLKCPIATAELLNREFLTFPEQEEAKKYLIQMSKAGKINKKGKRILYLNGRNRKDFENCVFVEDYLEILDYLKKIRIPIIESERGGNRVITGFNFLPSILRPLCKFKGQDLVEADYSTLHPNIVQYLYGGSNKDIITHDKVAEYLSVDRSVAKLGHLSFFNLSWEQMYHSPLFKYYYENENMMMHNIYEAKLANGYKETSKNCFIFETDLMRENLKDLKKESINALYCFDAIYTTKEELSKVREIMNKNAELHGLKTRV